MSLGDDQIDFPSLSTESVLPCKYRNARNIIAPDQAMRKPVSSLIEKIRQRKPQLSHSVISVEDLQKLSNQSLVDFQQNLEMFRREPLQGKSDLIAHLLEVASSTRLTRYLEAGGLHEDSARQVVINLHSALKGLQTHVKQAKTLLMELESFVKKNSDLMLSTLCENLENVEISPFGTEEEENFEAHRQSAEPRCIHRGPQAADYVHVMSLILCMLVEDFQMQEKIVNALGLDSKTEALQSYSVMWTLRPYVDDIVIEQALNWIK